MQEQQNQLVIIMDFYYLIADKVVTAIQLFLKLPFEVK